MTKIESKISYIRPALLEMPPKFDPPTEGYLKHQGLNTELIRPMGLNECNFPPSPKIIEAIKDNLEKIARYPDSQPPRLSQIISQMFKIEPNNIVWGNGSEELIKGAIDLSVKNGDGIILPVPTFWGYRALVAAAEAETTFTKLNSDGTINVEGVKQAINNKTKLVFCVTPNNPTGLVLPEDDLNQLITQIPNDVLFVVDEAYFEFAAFSGGPDVVKALKERSGPWIIIRTFSKAYAMAGMRIGYALCSDAVLAQALRKTTCVFNVPILAMFAAEAGLSDTSHLKLMMKRVSSARNQLISGLCSLGLKPISSVTNFVSVEVPIPGRIVVEKMLNLGVQIHAWPDPGYENFIRITVGQKEDNNSCLKSLEEVLKDGI